MKRTCTILFAAMLMATLASCLDAAGNANENPIYSAPSIHQNL